MINIEEMVIDTVSKAVKSKFPAVSFYSEHVEVPPSFPAVSLCEEDNSTYEKTLDTSPGENHARLLYVANVYSNKAALKKREAKEIAGIVDKAMQSLKFIRILRSPIPNADKAIYRITMRYTAVVDEGKEENGKTVYQMYRR